MAPVPSLLADRFELGERIGEGSVSVVHAATDRTTGRTVAIKLGVRAPDGPDAARRRFEREAAALSVIASAHVVELISAGTSAEGTPFLVLERLVGKNLQDIVTADGPRPPTDVVRIIAEAATALELAHGVGIVHRDLKPANLFVHQPASGAAAGSVVKVLDFGMVVDTAGPTERMRDAFGGTPLYMAPEQVRGQLTRIGPATDIWAVAMVTLTLLTGEVYWTESSATDVMREIESSPLDRPSLRWAWLPEAFDAWFLRSTRRVPERRFKSVATQASQLAEALRGARSPGRAITASLVEANTMVAARTPTPSVVRMSGQRTPVVGRELDSHAIEQLLAPAAVVTITGPAGIGKTRLAQAVCDAAGDRFVDGAWFVPLAAGDGDAAVMSAIATALGLEPDATRSIGEHVVTSLAPRRVLVVLDGAEHVTGCADAIERLRRRCPAVGWLVTSRLALDVPGERCHALEPLDLPATAASAGEAETFSAIELFVRSAREARPSFALDDTNVDDVVAICRAVEGFPLGLELAAARIQASTPAQIRAALEDDAPVGGAQPSSVRHAVEWSYGLLAPDQQRMLRHLAVFPAGLTFDQMKRRLGALSDDPMYAVLRLVQTHLAAWTTDAPRRLVMLDTVRELCHDRSLAAGEDAQLWQVARAHAEAIAVEGTTGAIATETWLALVDAEHDNLRAVLAHLLDSKPADAMSLAGRLAYYWYLRGDYLEGSHWLETSVAKVKTANSETLGRALHGAGRLALLTCRYQRAGELLLRARELARATDDTRGAADADQLLGSVARERGDYPRARDYHQRSLDAWRKLGDPRQAARARNYLVFAAWLGAPTGEPGDEQRAWWQGDGEAELDRLGDPETSVWYFLNRGAILHHAGDGDGARAALGRAFAEAIAARFHEGIAWALELLGKGALARGEHLQARAQLAAALRVHRRLGDRWRCASVLEALAAVAVASERPARGAVYLGAADAIRLQIGAPVPACERAMVERTERDGTAAIGESFELGRERGRRAPLDHTVELSRDVA